MRYMTANPPRRVAWFLRLPFLLMGAATVAFGIEPSPIATLDKALTRPISIVIGVIVFQSYWTAGQSRRLDQAFGAAYLTYTILRGVLFAAGASQIARVGPQLLWLGAGVSVATSYVLARVTRP